jgi:hypothetical protein
VVVIGVLLALGADQAVRYVSDRIETAEARERIVGEVNTLAVIAVERIALDRCVIPICMDYDPSAQFRRSMGMIRQGWSMSLFQASQQWPTMLRRR